jgi:hypothetical protein
MLSGIAAKAQVWDYLTGTILLYAPLTVLYNATGNAVLVMKVVPSILYGFLGWCVYQLGIRRLSLPPAWALAVTLLATSYFLTLRISWDLQRNILGLSLAVLTLALLKDNRGTIRYVVVPLTSSLAVMAHESATALIALFVIGDFVDRKDARKTVLDLARFVPAAALVILQISSGRDFAAQFQVAPQGEVFSGLTYNLGFLVYSYFALIPLVLLGLRRMTDRPIRSWLLAGLLLGTLPNLGLLTGPPSRWTIVLSIPMAIAAFYGARQIMMLQDRIPRIAGRGLLAATVIVVIVMSSGYVGLHVLHRDYLNIAPQYLYVVPSSMTLNTVPREEVEAAFQIADWVVANLPPDARLVVPFQLYGWLLIRFSEHAGIDYTEPEFQRNLDDIVGAIQPRQGPRLIYAREVDIYISSTRSLLLERAYNETSDVAISVYVVWWEPQTMSKYFGGLPDDFDLSFVAKNLAVYLLRPSA